MKQQLPKIDKPLFPIKTPSTGEELLYRQFLVAEEKILLIAQQSGEERDIIRAIKQIITNCVQGDLDVSKMPFFDLEYIFLKLRSLSVSNIAKVIYTDSTDGSEVPLDVDLDKVEVQFGDKPIDPIVWIDEKAGFGLKLTFPSVDDTIAFKDPELDQGDAVSKVIESCIEEVFTAEDVYQFSDYSPQEQAAFIDEITIPVFAKIQEFYDKMPVLRHTIKYTPKGKEENSITLEGLNDFFSWG